MGWNRGFSSGVIAVGNLLRYVVVIAGAFDVDGPVAVVPLSLNGKPGRVRALIGFNKVI